MWIDDDILRKSELSYFQAVWEPTRPIAILGSSNKAEVECNMLSCAEDGVDVLRRYGGGGTVVLHPGCVILSIGTWVNHHYQNDIFFKKINQAVVDCLSAKWPSLTHLTQRGLSDICSGDKKIAGTSLFRSRNYLLYQASILVQPEMTIINKYLKHPSKEPDYRQGRSHQDFLIGLHDLCGADAKAIAAQLEHGMQAAFENCLKGDLQEPIADQIPHLLKRANQGTC